MQEIAKRLAEFQPDDIQWTISLAYAAPASGFDSSSEGNSAQRIDNQKTKWKRIKN
jgi:hypothetical protein